MNVVNIFIQIFLKMDWSSAYKAISCSFLLDFCLYRYELMGPWHGVGCFSGWFCFFFRYFLLCLKSYWICVCMCIHKHTHTRTQTCICTHTHKHTQHATHTQQSAHAHKTHKRTQHNTFTLVYIIIHLYLYKHMCAVTKKLICFISSM